MLCASTNTNDSTQSNDAEATNSEIQSEAYTEVQYDYQLKAGETACAGVYESLPQSRGCCHTVHQDLAE